MSSEVFSSAYLDARRKLQLAKQLRRDLEKAAEGIKKLSSSINRSMRVLKQQGDEIARELAEQKAERRVLLQMEESASGQTDISGFTREEISQLAELVKKNTQLLHMHGDVDVQAAQAEKSAIGIEAFDGEGTEEIGGFVREEITVAYEESPEARKILQLGELLSGITSKKDIEYTELLIVAYGVLDEPVWSMSDSEHKLKARRRLERIELDTNMTVFEKIERIKALLGEYTHGLSEPPQDADVQQVVSTYKILCQRLGREYDGTMAAIQMNAQIEQMTQELISLEEQEYIADAIAEAFEEEGILLDDVKTAGKSQVFYLKDTDSCEVVISDVAGGFLLETVGLYEEGTAITEADRDEMKATAKGVCDAYKRVIARLAEKGVIIEITAEDDPAEYLKICEESAETFARRRKEKERTKSGAKERRRRRRRGGNLRTFD